MHLDNYIFLLNGNIREMNERVVNVFHVVVVFRVTKSRESMIVLEQHSTELATDNVSKVTTNSELSVGDLHTDNDKDDNDDDDNDDDDNDDDDDDVAPGKLSMDGKT
jgi:hypothetical protein